MLFAEAVSDSGTSAGFREALPLPDGGHIVAAGPLGPYAKSVRNLMRNVFEENQLPYGNTRPERVKELKLRRHLGPRAVRVAEEAVQGAERAPDDGLALLGVLKPSRRAGGVKEARLPI